MCGIAGEVAYERRIGTKFSQDMSDQIRHRGPDDSGLWMSSTEQCVLSFRRLSIIDLSLAGHQPMIDPLTGNAIVFNGEIYNFEILKRQCLDLGDKFRSGTDTEVLLALYRRHGARCLNFLRGMFSFAIWDNSKHILFFARDRIGKKPFNYALVKGAFIFCSEIRPLSLHPEISDAEDLEALDLYLQLQYIPAPRTVYRDIRKLPPAHFGIFSASGLHIERYWDVDYRPKLNLNETEALEAFEEKVNDAVRQRMTADVPLGVLLSGGVDSSVIAAVMAQHTAAPVKTFSVGFEDARYNELSYAEEAARLIGTEHHPLIASGDTDVLPKLTRRYGEPFADPSALPSFFVCEAARQHVTVALNGDGGDELLGGYWHYNLSEFSLACGGILGHAVETERLLNIVSNLGPHAQLFSRMSRRVLRDFFHPELGSWYTYNALWSDRERRSLSPEIYRTNAVANVRNGWLLGAQAKTSNVVDHMLYFDSNAYLAGDLLPKMDIASMHCGLEARSPFLDHELIEFCAALPIEFKVRNGTGKYLLKKLAEKHYSRAFVHRPKMGFGIPIANWLRGPLKEILCDTLYDRDLMNFFDNRVVAKYLERFLSNAVGDHDAHKLWTLLMYGVWKRESDKARLKIRSGEYVL